MHANTASRILHGLGLYLFTSGFLLTRLVLDHESQCLEPPIPLDYPGFKGSYESGCWHPKRFNKVVVILIDALRYDFTVPFSEASAEDAPHHFHDRLQVFYEIAVKEPQNAVLLPFIADPPTSTSQRLKGLTTGTLPTFIDISKNFAGTAVDEDNLIAQLRNASKTVVQLGDDTWQGLFPGQFDPELTRPFDSFDVSDLHTVDNGVTEHLLPLLHKQNTTRWDFLIGHYLGVDHAGHRFGPDHPEMAAKLMQLDVVMRQVVQLLHKDTLLVVMGDHGMDRKGDHGGESDDEIEAALWMYSKKGIFGRAPNDAGPRPPMTARQGRRVWQIDLVPTLSLLMGLPVPFNNLGTPIAEAFVGADGRDHENIARAARVTAAQINRYLQEYATVRNLESSRTTEPATPLAVRSPALGRPQEGWLEKRARGL